jgi:hypothetical protein
VSDGAVREAHGAKILRVEVGDGEMTFNARHSTFKAKGE